LKVSSFEEETIVDHSLLMDVIKAVSRHTFKVLYLNAEKKPGINAAGKHNNWSFLTNTGVKLPLSRKYTYEESLKF
jgi:glutamine synthetase